MGNIPPDEEQAGGLNRRSVLKRGAIVGGAMVWTVPAVQSLAGPAFAAGTPCVGGQRTYYGNVCFEVTYRSDTTCCNCIATTLAGTFGGDPIFTGVAAGICQVQGKCQVETANPC